jgi:hypothetical protein
MLVVTIRMGFRSCDNTLLRLPCPSLSSHRQQKKKGGGGHGLRTELIKLRMRTLLDKAPERSA